MAQQIGAQILESSRDEETPKTLFAVTGKKAIAAMGDNYAKAEEYFSQLTGQNLQMGHIYQNLALSQEKQGKKAESVQSWSKALELFQQELKKSPEDEYRKALVLAIHKYTGGKLLEDGGLDQLPVPQGTRVRLHQAKELEQAVDALKKPQGASDDVDVLCQFSCISIPASTRAFHMWNLALKKGQA